MVSTTEISAFIDSRADNEISLWNFTEQYHHEFGKEIDTAFMEYFFQVLSPRENNGQFVVHKDKLVEYAIVSDGCSSPNISNTLISLGLNKETDFALRDTSEQTRKGIKRKNAYFLTPKALKICFIRSQSRYADYYLFLEDVVGYHAECSNKYFNSEIRKLNNKLSDADATIENARTRLQSVITQSDVDTTKLDSMIACAVDRLNQMNLANPKIPHNFAIMSHEFVDPKKGKGHKIAVIAGDESAVRKSIHSKINDETCAWTIDLGLSGIADPVALRNKVPTCVKDYVQWYVTHTGETRKEQKRQDFVRATMGDDFAKTYLPAEPYGAHAGYSYLDKTTTKIYKMIMEDIITWNKTSAAFFDNRVMTYDTLITWLNTFATPSIADE
jgi:hypothetical protein